MSSVKPIASSEELHQLLRQCRKTVSLDYIKWWAHPGIARPGMKRIEQQGSVVTMHDATPARLEPQLALCGEPQQFIRIETRQLYGLPQGHVATSQQQG